MAKQHYVVVATHPDNDTSVAVGTFTIHDRAIRAAGNLDRKGWVTEIVALIPLGEIPNMKRTGEGRSMAAHIENEHQAAVHADGSECPDGCGGA